MKKIFALLALVAFIGVVSTPATANVNDNIDNTVQVVMDNDNSNVADQDPVKTTQSKKKVKKTATVTKSAAKGCGGCAEKAGCEEAGKAKEGCASECAETKTTAKKETKKKTL